MSLPQNTNFIFEHKVFSIDGVHFALNSDGAPVMHMFLGEVAVSVAFPQLCVEFGIEPESDDGKMLAMVREGLRFIKVIRPNDSIPSEILDGSASWSVEPRHLDVAKMRLAVQLSNWVTKGEAKVLDARQLQVLFADETTKKHIQQGFEEIAQALDLGPEGKTIVADKVDHFASELAYIEALTDRVQMVVRIHKRLKKLIAAHAKDQMAVQEFMRMEALLRKPLKDMVSRIEDVHAQTSEIMTILKNFPGQVQFVRRVRDDLRTELLDWDELITEWNEANAAPDQEGDELEALCKKTYRFLAENYQQVQSWG